MGFQWRHPIRRHQCHQSLFSTFLQCAFSNVLSNIRSVSMKTCHRTGRWNVLNVFTERIPMMRRQCHKRSTTLVKNQLVWKPWLNNNDNILLNLLECWIKPSIKKKLTPSKCFLEFSVMECGEEQLVAAILRVWGMD